MQNTEENLIYVEVDNFNYHNHIMFGFNCERIEEAVFKLLQEQFDEVLIDENHDDIVLEVERHYADAKKELDLAH